MAEEKPKVTVHWLNKSRAQRIIWLLEECKLDYEIKVYKRGKDMLAPPDLKNAHPLGKSPVIEVKGPQAEKPIVLAESGAITEYLADYFAKQLIPKRYPDGKEGQVGCETEEWIRYRYYMHYAEGSLMSLLLIKLIMTQIRAAPVPFFIKPIIKQVPAQVEKGFLNKNFETHFEFLEEQLKTSPGGGEFLCGKDLTAADILMSFPLEVSDRAGMTKDKYPKLWAYVEKLHQQDGYDRATKRIEKDTGEPYDAKL